MNTSLHSTKAPVQALTDTTQKLLASIPDEAVRQDTTGVVHLALETLAAFNRLHLPQDAFEMDQQERAKNDLYLELAPYVLSALAAANRLLAHITARFPAPAEEEEAADDFDFDFDFDLAGDAGDDPAANEQGINEKGTAVDDGPDVKSALPPAEQIGEATHAYGSMLRSRMLQLGDRLRHAIAQDESWPLLAELDDGKHRVTKAVQGLLFGTLSVFGGEFRRDEVLPEYRSVLSESITLRTAISELTFHIGKFNTALAQADADAAIPLLVGVADRLTRFSSRPEYRTMRADDKKAVIDFRQALYRVRHARDGLSMTALRQAVEGFSKFLESLQAINHREVLVLHDQQRLQGILRQLGQIQESGATDPEGGRLAFSTLLQSLSVLQGRNPELDDWRRDFGPDGLDHAELAPTLERLGAILQQTLMMVG